MLKLVSLTFFRQIFAGLLQVVTLIIIARFLTVAEMGQYTLAILIPSLLAPMLTLGLQSANIYGIGRKLVTGSEALYVNLVTLIGLGILGIVGTLIFLQFFGAQFFPNISPSLLVLATFAILPLLFLNVLPSLFQALQEYTLFNLITVIQPLFLLVVTLISLFIKSSIDYVVYAYVIASFLTFFGLIIILVKKITPRPYPVMTFYKSFFSYSLASHFSNIVTLLNYRSSLLLLGYFTNPTQVGLYSVALQLVEKLWLPSQAVSVILLPKITHQVDDSPEKVTKLTLTTARLVLLLTSAIALVFVILLPFIIKLLFGVAYEKSAMICLLLLVGIVLWAPSRVLANDIAARGLASVNLHNAVYVLLANVILSLILIYYYGYLGAAVATSIAYSLDLILRMAAYQKITHVKVLPELLPRRSDITMVVDLVKGFRHGK